MFKPAKGIEGGHGLERPTMASIKVSSVDHPPPRTSALSLENIISIGLKSGLTLLRKYCTTKIGGWTAPL